MDHGKSTLVNCISGQYKPERGTIKFYHKEITRFSPHRVLKIGLARTFQTVRIYQELSAFENVQVSLTTVSPSRSPSSSMKAED